MAKRKLKRAKPVKKEVLLALDAEGLTSGQIAKKLGLNNPAYVYRRLARLKKDRGEP